MSILVVLGIAFAVVAGINDGAALLALNLPNARVRPIVALGLLSSALVVVPLILGMGVARTYATGLVGFSHGPGTVSGPALGFGVSAAVVVVFLLVRAGIATSLTVALVGGIVGSGLAVGAPVDWWGVVRISGFAVLALAFSLAAGRVAARLLAGANYRAEPDRQLGLLGLLAFGTLAVAYGANDGQKMFAVLALLAGTDLRSDPLAAAPEVLIVAAAFCLGALIGIGRLGPRLGQGVVPGRAAAVVSGESGAALAVLIGAAVALPVSMVQATTAGVVGATMDGGAHRVRWGQASRMLLAWVITLPATLAVAALAAAAGTAIAAR